MPWALSHRAVKKRLAWALYEKLRFHSSSCLHSTSQLETDQLLSLGYRGPIVTAPNGIDIPPIFPRDGAQPRAVRKATFLGRVHPKKGLPLLIQAWKAVGPKDWIMQVFGPDEGGHLKEVIDLVSKHSLQDSWHFFPEQSDSGKWAHLAESDLFILPSYSENFGIAVAEALASGVPTIATNTTPWSGLTDYGCGWCVAPDIDSLSVALSEATNTPSAVLRSMGMLGRDWMARDFSWQDVGKTILSAYDSLLASRRTGPVP